MKKLKDMPKTAADAKLRATIAERIVTARTYQKMRQTALARAVGSSSQIIHALEHGVSVPSGRMLIRLADALGCSTDYLLGRCSNAN